MSIDAEATTRLDRLERIVARLKWVEGPYFLGTRTICPVCSGEKYGKGHSPGCEMAALVEEVKATSNQRTFPADNLSP